MLLCRAPLRREKLAPTAKLTKILIPLRPSHSIIAPLVSGRDSLPENKTVHKLELTYQLKVEESGSFKPTLPTLNKWGPLPDTRFGTYNLTFQLLTSWSLVGMLKIASLF